MSMEIAHLNEPTALAADAILYGPSSALLSSLEDSLLRLAAGPALDAVATAGKVRACLLQVRDKSPDACKGLLPEISTLTVLLDQLGSQSDPISPLLCCTSPEEVTLWFKEINSPILILEGLIAIKCLRKGSWLNLAVENALSSLHPSDLALIEMLLKMHQLRFVKDTTLPQDLITLIVDCCFTEKAPLSVELSVWHENLLKLWREHQLHPKELAVLKKTLVHLLPLMEEVLNYARTMKIKSLRLSVSHLLDILHTIADAPLRSEEEMTRSLLAKEQAKLEAEHRQREADVLAEKLRKELRVQTLTQFSQLSDPSEIVDWAKSAPLSSLVEVCNFVGKLNDRKRQRLTTIITAVDTPSLLSIFGQLDPRFYPRVKETIAQIGETQPSWMEKFGNEVKQISDSTVAQVEQLYQESLHLESNQITPEQLQRISTQGKNCSAIIKALECLQQLSPQNNSAFKLLLIQQTYKLKRAFTLIDNKADCIPANIFYQFRTKAYPETGSLSQEIFSTIGNWGLNTVPALAKIGLIPLETSTTSTSLDNVWRMVQDRLLVRGILVGSDFAKVHVYNVVTLEAYLKSSDLSEPRLKA